MSQPIRAFGRGALGFSLLELLLSCSLAALLAVGGFRLAASVSDAPPVAAMAALDAAEQRALERLMLEARVSELHLLPGGGFLLTGPIATTDAAPGRPMAAAVLEPTRRRTSVLYRWIGTGGGGDAEGGGGVLVRREAPRPLRPAEASRGASGAALAPELRALEDVPAAMTGGRAEVVLSGLRGVSLRPGARAPGGEGAGPTLDPDPDSDPGARAGGRGAAQGAAAASSGRPLAYVELILEWSDRRRPPLRRVLALAAGLRFAAEVEADATKRDSDAGGDEDAGAETAPRSEAPINPRSEVRRNALRDAGIGGGP